MQMFLFHYFLILFLACPSIIHATCNLNLCDDATAPGITDRSDWMSKLIDQLQLKQFSLPGTHDSGTYGNLVNEVGFEWYTDCQVWSLDVQLKTGIRFFDWRLESRANSIYVHHGDYSYDVSWTSILETSYDFLTKHKSETLIFRVGFSGITTAFFNQITAPYAGKIVYYQEDRIPQLIHVRGEIVLIVPDTSVINGMINVPGDNGFLYNSNMAAEDVYRGVTISTKLGYIKTHLSGASTDYHRWHISYSSYSYGVGPIDKAEVINPDIYDYVKGYSTGRNIGVLVMDFPGDGLIGAVIDTNTGLDTIAQCCFYIDSNYGGKSFCIQSDMTYVGDEFNDKISSWKCSDGRYAIIYKDINYGGDKYLTECRTKTPNADSTWNDKISSIKLKYCDQDYQYATKSCAFFVDKDWSGDGVTYTGNQPTLGAANDKFSSWDCDPQMGAIIYEHDNYRGSSITIGCGTRQQNAEQISFNDKVSSLKVYKCPYCCFYSEENFQGDYFCTANDIQNLSPVFKGKITSYKCSSNAYATLTWKRDINDANIPTASFQTTCGQSISLNTYPIVKVQIHTCDSWSADTKEEITETTFISDGSSRFKRNLQPWHIGIIVATISTLMIAIIVVAIVMWKRKRQQQTMPGNDEPFYVEMSK